MPRVRSLLAAAALAVAALATPGTLAAETLVAARTVRAMSVLMPEDLAVSEDEVPGALRHPDEALGLEARTMLYQGRPIRPSDVGPAALVERNALVALVFRRGGLTITAEGRALGRGAVGDRLRVINLSSRTVVTGTVEADGRVAVGSFPGS
jgi:flagella basal body P-ring formation protein FlgA